MLTEKQVRKLVSALRQAPTVQQKAKDLERASGLTMLPPSDPQVVSEDSKSKSGKALSPPLLVRGRLNRGRPLTIADGFHRICASYYAAPDAAIPCRIVDLPGPRS